MVTLLRLVTQIRRMKQIFKKSFNQHEKSAVHRFTVNRSVEVPSLTDNIAETVTKKSVRNTTKKLISFNENSK